MSYFHLTSKGKIFILLLFCCLTISAYSQETSTQKWKFNFQFDNRYSNINGNQVTIFGSKVGVQYRKMTRFGIGGSFILHPIDVYITNRKGKITGDTKISFWYFSIFNDWILYKSKHWETFFTEQIGFGKPELVQTITKGNVITERDPNLYVNEISWQANYKITPWIGVGAGFGYRNILNQESVLKSRFNAPVYIFKVIVFPETFFN
jgi:hypothetical protein